MIKGPKSFKLEIKNEWGRKNIQKSFFKKCLVLIGQDLWHFGHSLGIFVTLWAIWSHLVQLSHCGQFSHNCDNFGHTLAHLVTRVANASHFKSILFWIAHYFFLCLRFLRITITWIFLKTITFTCKSIGKINCNL